MEKFDHRKTLTTLYHATVKKVAEIDVPAMNYLMVDGASAPGSEEFIEAIEALYPLAYTLKFMVKKGPLALDYRVLPLEGLWWAEDMSAFIEPNRKDEWQWTLMIMQPDFITEDMVATARAEVATKKAPVALDKLRFERFTEGPCVQALHKGPFDEEGPTIEKLHQHIRGTGRNLHGKHHEIYLSDMRRTAPANLKTILRQPFLH